jgi:hypothetical protein
MEEEFKIFAEDNGIPLDHPDDYDTWYKCWSNGFNTAIQRYSIWNDGDQTIGAMNTNIKNILIKEGF